MKRVLEECLEKRVAPKVGHAGPQTPSPKPKFKKKITCCSPHDTKRFASFPFPGCGAIPPVIPTSLCCAQDYSTWSAASPLITTLAYTVRCYIMPMCRDVTSRLVRANHCCCAIATNLTYRDSVSVALVI